jgi:hypothetical protein
MPGDQDEIFPSISEAFGGPKRKKPPKPPRDPNKPDLGDFFRDLGEGIRGLTQGRTYSGVETMAQNNRYDAGGPGLPGENPNSAQPYPQAQEPPGRIGSRKNADITLNPAAVAMGQGVANMSRDQANMPDSGSGVGAQGMQPGQGTPERRLLIGVGGGREASVSIVEGRRFVADKDGNPADVSQRMSGTQMTVNTVNRMLNGDEDVVSRYRDRDFAQELGQDLDDPENREKIGTVLADMGYDITDRKSIEAAMDEFVAEKVKDEPALNRAVQKGVRRGQLTYVGLQKLQEELESFRVIYNNEIAE